MNLIMKYENIIPANAILNLKYRLFISKFDRIKNNNGNNNIPIV